MILSLMSILSIIVFGSIILWTDSLLLRNYFHEYNKYDSIRVGMTKKEVLTIMKVTPGERPTREFRSIINYDQALVYPIPLEGEPPHSVVVFYKNDKVVGKEAHAQETSIFNTEEVSEMRKSSVTSVVRLIQIMLVGIVGALVWLVIYPRYKTIRENSGKKFWISLSLGFCFITSLLVVVFLGLGVLINIVDILFIIIRRNVFYTSPSLSLFLAIGWHPQTCFEGVLSSGRGSKF